MAINIVKKPTWGSHREFDAFEPAAEDLCIALEWQDDPETMAMFYEMEWERISAELEAG
jgi:hypothetical protein